MDDHRAKKLKSEDEEDRISKLPDGIIHLILSFLDNARFAVQSSILSKRWKRVWATLPFLTFEGYNQHSKDELNRFINTKFINHVFTSRENESQIRKLNLCSTNGLPTKCLIRCLKYAISHGVQSLNVKTEHYCPLSLFNSASLKDLKLTMVLENDDVNEADSWILPNLTDLYLELVSFSCTFRSKFPLSCLHTLSALTTLRLVCCNLPEFLSLPCLKILYLKYCSLPKNGWYFPALLSLELDNVDMSTQVCVISDYELLNLIIIAHGYNPNASAKNFVVSAPKLRNFTAIGSFPFTFEGCETESVEIKFLESLRYSSKQQLLDLYKMMFSQLGSAKNLAIDLETLQNLSKIKDMLVRLESPFYNLKHLELPPGCKESSISSIVRQYLLGASPKATIVERLKTSVQDNAIPQIAPAISATAQNMVLEQPLGTPNSKKIRSQDEHENKDIRKPKERN